MFSSANLLSFEPRAVKFLNSQQVSVCGNGPRGKIQILSTCRSNDTNLMFQNLNEIKFPSSIIDNIEICGISSLARSCVAVSSRGVQANQYFIGILDVDLLNERCQMKLSSTLQNDVSVKSNFTSLSFYVHQTALASSNELGDICIWDIVSEKEINNFCADACGVNKIVYTRSGQILTGGNSSESQLRLWDTRQNARGVTNTVIKSCLHPKQDSNYSYTVYTTLQNHNSLPIVYCGTNDGKIVEWDLRYDTGTPTSVFSCHASDITSVLLHPFEENTLISSSLDGTVRVNNVHDKYSDSNGILIAESSAITSMDCNVDGVIIASSSLGSLIVRKL